MKRLLLLLTLTFATNAMADPLPPTECTDGVTVASIAASCSVGGTIFSNFAYEVTGSGANLAPTAAEVYIHIVNTLLSPQLVFTANPAWNLEGPQGGRSNNSYNAFID